MASNKAYIFELSTILTNTLRVAHLSSVTYIRHQNFPPSCHAIKKILPNLKMLA